MFLLCAGFESRPELYRRIFMDFLPNYFNRCLLTNLWNAPQKIGETKQKKTTPEYNNEKSFLSFLLLCFVSKTCRFFPRYYKLFGKHEPQEYSGIFFLIPLHGECSSWFSHCSNANLQPTNSSPKVSARRFWHKSVRKHLSSRVHKQIYRSANKHHNFSTKVQPTDAVGCCCWCFSLTISKDHVENIGLAKQYGPAWQSRFFAPRSAKGRKGRKLLA